ncbi:MAG: hypothetical protein MAGBODY4_00098 [Candidatus Marinimicrobia bacterium]|nr:hypothetical protein [Candidatus Neomarinimicrobiota bacterium]
MNENNIDRFIRVILGVILLALAIFSLQGTLAWIIGIVGGIVLVTGITGFCLIYKLIGVSTLKGNSSSSESQ